MTRLIKPIILAGLFVPLILVSAKFYNLPPVQERLAWRVEAVKARIKYAISPPQEAIFVPQGPSADLPPPEVRVITPTSTPEIVEDHLQPINTPEPTLTATPLPTPLPDYVQLAGVRHEYQTWNNCGPATLSMYLSYWDWSGDQRQVAAVTKPNPRDKNVMPDELAAFVSEQTEFEVAVRVGGDLQLLNSLLAAGYPVMVEKGIEQEDGWLGHYVLVTGYDDNSRTYSMMDSLRGPDQTLQYEVLENQWRAFNYTYLLVYPAGLEFEVMEILGLQADENANYLHALQKATAEISALSGRDVYFAWFNLGTNLMALEEFADAAAAYDQAFALYSNLPTSERPWRMMWYQIGPYQAYFHTGRYQDVIDLATTTLRAMSEPVLEESYYWRALAREVLGDIEGAITDLRTSLVHHSGFSPSVDQLNRLLGEE
jgi:hypothetical protein